LAGSFQAALGRSRPEPANITREDMKKIRRRRRDKKEGGCWLMAPRQCQIHCIGAALYILTRFFILTLEKPLPCPFFSYRSARVFLLFKTFFFNTHIYREGTLQFVLLYIVTLRE
jgi:hypothetical protein